MRNRVPRRAPRCAGPVVGDAGRSIRWWMSPHDPPEPTAGRPTPHAGPRRRPRRAAPGLAAAALAAAGQPVPAARDPVGRPGRGDPPRVAADPGRDRRRGPRRPGARRVRRRRRDASTGRPGASGSTRRRSRRSIASAPPSSTLHARNPERNIVFGGANLVFGAVGGPAFVSDLDRGRRAGQLRRLRRLRPAHRRARRHPPGGRRPARAERPAGRDPPPRHVPDVRGRARQDLAVPRASGRGRSTTRSRSLCLDPRRRPRHARSASRR